MLRHSHSEEETGYTDSYRHRRYDPATACEIVERAAALQEEERAMSAAEVEELARRSGVDPRYVRQVMAEMETGSIAYPRYPLTPRERRFAVLYPLGYGLILFFQMFWLTKIHEPIAPLAVLFFLPAALSFYLGGRLGKPRPGAMAGLLTAAATITAVYFGIWMVEGRAPRTRFDELAVLLGMLAGGAAIGALGAEVRKRLPRWIARRRKRRARAAEYNL
jgi:cation transport ATPase